MKNVRPQSPQPNQNGPHHQHAPVPLPPFPRLNPTMFRNSVQPLDADDWLRNITHELESANVDPADNVNFVSYHLKGAAAQWWSTHKCSLLVGEVISWDEFQSAFRTCYIPQGIMDRKAEKFRNLT